MAWYNQQRPGFGDTFLTAIDDGVSLIARWPRSGAPVDGLHDDIEIRRVPVPRFPYHLAYAVAHDRRRPGYWAPRASPETRNNPPTI